MRIQNIKNGAQYTDGSFHYSLFFSPQPASATQLPTECICSNTINVTFADCLLAFYLNGNSALAAAAAAAASSSCFAGVPLCTLLLRPAHFPSAVIRGLPKQQPQLWQCDGVCVCVHAPGRLWEDWEGHRKPECFLLGKILFFLLGFSKTLILPAKCKIICCCDGTKRQMISGVRNS